MSAAAPKNIEAEQCVLGSVVLSARAMDKVALMLRVEDFFDARHRVIYKAILALMGQSVPIDLVTLVGELQDSHELDDAGGPAYISALIDIVPSVVNIDHYANIVRDKSILRRVIHISSQIIDRCHGQSDDIDLLLDDAIQSYNGISDASMGISNWPEPIDLAASFVDPPPTLNWLWPGFLAGSVGVLMAAGGTGKSYWALQAAMAVACGGGDGDLLRLRPKVGGRVVYIAAEDPIPVLVTRIQAIGRFLPAAVKNTIAERLDLLPMMGKRLDIMANIGRLIAYCADARLIILDTISRLHDLSENDNSDMARLVSALEHLADSTGAAILYLHHVDKASARSGQRNQQAARGASALVDNARWGGLLSRMSEAEARKHNITLKQGRRYLRYSPVKQNYTVPLPDCWYVRQDDGVLNLVELKAKRKPQQAVVDNCRVDDNDW